MSSPHGSIAPLPARWRAASAFLGVVTLVGALFVALASLGCGRFLVLKGPGEPCTRTTECRSDLLCTAGVCTPGPDSGVTPLDASTPRESGLRDATEPPDAGESLDADDPNIDADTDAAAAPDADARPDADVIDDAGEPADSGAADAP